MKKVLILIGAGYTVNKCAASLIVGNLGKDCDVRICEVSKTRVHIRLEEYLNKDIEQIFMIGTSLVNKFNEVAKVAKKISKKEIEMIWISAIPIFNEVQSKELEKYINLYYKEKCILDITRTYLKVQKGDELFKHLNKVICEGRSDNDTKVADLINAVSSRYRRFQDMQTLEDVLKNLATYKSAYIRDTLLQKYEWILNEFYRFGSREIKGVSQKTQDLKALIKKVGQNGDSNVLISGETGTGKESIAYLIHAQSNRKDNNFIPFNCADMSPDLIESKLFGHLKGSFTGADKDRVGAFELADGGTLFLDELTELSKEVQAGLLRVIQEQRFKRLGGEDDVNVDVRIIGATNKDIFKLIREGKFREDLYYRLNTIEIESIPLRDNKEDIAYIANNYAINKGYGTLTEQQIVDLTEEYDWYGNVRELQNIIDRSKILEEENFSKILKEYKSKKVAISANELENADDILREHAKKMLQKYKGNKTHASKAMGKSLNTFKSYFVSN